MGFGRPAGPPRDTLPSGHALVLPEERPLGQLGKFRTLTLMLLSLRKGFYDFDGAVLNVCGDCPWGYSGLGVAIDECGCFGQ